jgi:cold shock CspA family protein
LTGGITVDGTITSLVTERGFGIITDAAGEEFFLHRGALHGTDFEDLTEGSEVVFEARDRAAGDQPGERRRAVNVRLANDAAEAPDHERLPSFKVM